MLGGYAEAAYDVWPWLFGGEEKALEPFVRIEYVDTQYDVPSGFSANESSPSGNTRRVGTSTRTRTWC